MDWVKYSMQSARSYSFCQSVDNEEIRLGNPITKIETICWATHPRYEPCKEGIKISAESRKESIQRKFLPVAEPVSMVLFGRGSPVL
jgi:hypothetical protein